MAKKRPLVVADVIWAPSSGDDGIDSPAFWTKALDMTVDPSAPISEGGVVLLEGYSLAALANNHWDLLDIMGSGEFDPVVIALGDADCQMAAPADWEECGISEDTGIKHQRQADDCEMVPLLPHKHHRRVLEAISGAMQEGTRLIFIGPWPTHDDQWATYNANLLSDSVAEWAKESGARATGFMEYAKENGPWLATSLREERQMDEDLSLIEKTGLVFADSVHDFVSDFIGLVLGDYDPVETD